MEWFLWFPTSPSILLFQFSLDVSNFQLPACFTMANANFYIVLTINDKYSFTNGSTLITEQFLSQTNKYYIVCVGFQIYMGFFFFEEILYGKIDLKVIEFMQFN